MKKFTVKVIHIMNHPPAYEEYANKPRPEINWDTLNGSWVGIWGYDWSDQLASEILKVTEEFEHEVWQPDLRADKIYSHTFDNGLIHRMFPASISHKAYYSPQMLNFISENRDEVRCIFHLCYPHFLGINKNLLEAYKDQRFVLTFHGEIKLPYNAIFRMQKNPLKKIFYLRQHFQAKRWFKCVNHITYMNEKNLSSLKLSYKGQISKLTMGIDSSIFTKKNKADCREKTSLPIGKKVLITVTRLDGLKQVNKVIEILNKIEEDFFFVLIGHGTKEYEYYLKKLATPLLVNDKIRFVGYINGDELVNYLNAADLFLQNSQSEGSSVAVMEAMACGLPIFCTDTGNTAEVLKENNAGIVVGIKNYKEWEKYLIDYLKGKPIKALDIEVVKNHYDWKNVAEKFITIYKSLLWQNQ